MKISIIAAIGKNNELGKNNQLLWKLPLDLKHFREITSGHPVIMGRKTFESIGRPLPNRKNIVITRDESYSREGVSTVHSLKEALDLVQNEEEVFIIGGAEIYKQSIDLANKLYITHVDAETKDADVFFPTIGDFWGKISEERYAKNEENEHSFSFVEYEKSRA
jgi:dihydrofolate reductase